MVCGCAVLVSGQVLRLSLSTNPGAISLSLEPAKVHLKLALGVGQMGEMGDRKTKNGVFIKKEGFDEE